MELPEFRFNIWIDNRYEEYNCSSQDDIDWSSRGMRRPYFGLFCFLFGVMTIPPYCVCLITLWSMQKLSVYKIMVFLAVADIVALIFCAVIFGVMLITGEVYCAHPRWQLLFSFCGMCSLYSSHFSTKIRLSVAFFASTLCCFLLALNRFGEMLDVRFIISLFKGSRTWLVLGICCAPYVVVLLFTPPLLFNSTGHMIQYDPKIYEGRFVYNNMIVFSTCTVLPLASIALYLVMLFGLLCKHGNIAKIKNSKALSSATFQIVVQSGIIIVIHLTTVIAFEILPFFPDSAADTMLFVAHVGWIIVHATPSLVYVALNETIRARLFTLLKIEPTVTTVTTQQTVSRIS